MGFSAMLAEEYIWSSRRLSSVVRAGRIRPSFGIYSHLSIFTQQQYRAEVTQNISTAESPVVSGNVIRPSFKM